MYKWLSSQSGAVPLSRNRNKTPNMTPAPSAFQGSELTRSTPVPPDMRSHGLWAFESRHDQSFAMPITSHPFFKLLLIREGLGTLEFEGESSGCEGGDLVLVPARVRHRVIDLPKAPISLYGLGIDQRQLPCVASVVAGFRNGVYQEPLLRSLRIEQRLRKILYLHHQLDSASQLASIATAIDLLAELSLILDPPEIRGNATSSDQQGPPSTASAPLLEAYLAWLHRNFFEPLSLEDAAVATGMSRRTFTNRFKARTGTTWLNYLNGLRIQHAELLLTQTDKKITSIAFHCGFDDLTTFYRAFKRINGTNPSELRK
jgi:AraC-like DNA-binding protein/mannose-6-phosphate isomerase-like protein (cupin superfamily)